MAPLETPGAREERLFHVAEPHLRKLLRDAPAFGSVKLEIRLSEDEPIRVIYGAEVSRHVAPRADRGR